MDNILYKNRTDEELIELYQNGDINAFSILLENNRKSILHFINSYISDSDTRDDVYQEISIKIFIGLKYSKIGKIRNFKNWLYSVTYSTTFQVFRGFNYNNIDYVNDINSYACLIDIHETNHIEYDLFKNIQKLPPILRDTIILYYFKKKKHKEIAKIMGISINTSINRLHRAIQKLHCMSYIE